MLIEVCIAGNRNQRPKQNRSDCPKWIEAARTFYEELLGLVCKREHGCGSINETPIESAGGKQAAFLHPKSTFVLLNEFCR